MGKFGAGLLVVGIILIAVGASLPPERGATQIYSEVVVGNPFLKGAETVSVVNQVQGYVFPLGPLFSSNQLVGRLLGSIERSTFYLQVVLEGAGYLTEVQVKDYRNASQDFFNSASQIALAYTLELALGGGPTVIAVQLILDVALSGDSWTVSTPPRVQTAAVSSVSNAFGDIPGFIADALWGVYHFVEQNFGLLLIVFGLVLVAVGIAGLRFGA